MRTSAPGPAGLHWAHPRLVAHIGTGTAWAHPRLVAQIGTGTALGSPPRRPSRIRTGTGPPDCAHRHRECDATAQQNVLQQRAPVATASLREYPVSTPVSTPESTPVGTPMRRAAVCGAARRRWSTRRSARRSASTPAHWRVPDGYVTVLYGTPRCSRVLYGYCRGTPRILKGTSRVLQGN